MPAFLAWPAIKLFFGGALKSIWKAICAFFGSLNAQGWLGLGATVLMFVLWVHTAGEARHWHKQSGQFEKLYNADEASAKAVAAHAVKLKAQIEALQTHISQALKDKHDAEDRRIAADADAVRVRGPGKAACPGNPGLAPGSSGHQPTTPAQADAGSQVPSGEWAAVPWDWLVSVIEEHDTLLNEAQTWRENDRQQRAQRLTIPSPDLAHK